MSYRTTSTTQSGHVTTRVARTNSRFSRNYSGLLASLGFAAFVLVSAPALAATAPTNNLGSEKPFGVVSGTYTTTAAGTTLNGDLCYSTGPAAAPTVTG